MASTRKVIDFPHVRPGRDAPPAAPDRSMEAENGEERRPPAPADEMSARLTDVAEREDREAFAALFRHFGPRIRAWLRRGAGDAGQADEVLQEVFAAVWRKAHLYDSRRATAAAWIFAIARNRRIDALRRARRPEFDPEDPAFRPDPLPDAEQAIAAQQRTDAVRAAIAALSAEQQEVLRLSFYEGESYAAIAMRLGIPLGTVKSRARLAFRRLRAEIGPRREALR